MKLEIRELRNKTGLSQREFAKRYGIPLSTLRKWEQGDAKPAPYIVSLIASKLQEDGGIIANEEDKKEAAKRRIKDLIVLQKELCSHFPENEFNVFVFGSYPTVRFKDDSDVDIAIYTKRFDMYKEISVIVEEFFYDKGIPVDLFFIDTNIPAPVYLAPLRAQIQFTDYYPEELHTFEVQCEEELQKNKRSMLV